ncbi:hypothetical protein M388_13035 [Mesotoga sp. Brook.08.YT.4.2.5.4.]|nr:hypothetical protein M388_13035 [Mesotoga sp. Brook.08.YT.4.2.5.4.]
MFFALEQGSVLLGQGQIKEMIVAAEASTPLTGFFSLSSLVSAANLSTKLFLVFFV